MKKKAIVALGGNALIKEGQDGNIYDQFDNTREVSASLVKMIKDGWNIVVTHGNGPHVGAILLQNNIARDVTPPMPLGICVAESQGMIGYMIQQCLANTLKKAGINRPVVALITQALVDQNDPALSNPTKPIGPFYSEQEAKLLKKDGYQVKKLHRGWRIVVPSPDPKAIVEGEIIKKLLDDDVVVIASGGGGMPVFEQEGWGLNGIEAVIDKDLASERLAEAIDAELFMILTNVEKVYLNYNTPDQRPIDKIKLDELKRYYEENHFPPGSMGPKVLAAIRFLESGGKKVIISHVEKGYEALQGKTGTHISLN
ncbi:MAG: carbamate kinase [Candidatus Thermoplasmatota archaeon]|nr:carbamate kinase [Candidatus Thermoplasmatota archaeon]